MDKNIPTQSSTVHVMYSCY